MKVKTIIGLALIAVCLPVAGAIAQQEKTYVGFDTCVLCHQDQGEEWRKMCFRQPGTEEEIQAFHRGCEACHGPGSLHVDSIDPAMILRADKLPPGEQSAVCLQCHSRTISPSEWNRHHHGGAGISCITCHDVHQRSPIPRLLRKPQPDLCFDCHASQKGEFRQFSHHHIYEGRLKCTSCHQWYARRPSGEPVRAVADFCVQCHKEKQGPFLFEHDPVMESTDDACLTCHASHGSANKALLRLPPRPTCLQCHSDRVSHYSGLECASCHTELHGSNTGSNFINVRSSPVSRSYAPGEQFPAPNSQLSYGYNFLDLDGNFRRFFRYSFPPTDRFFLQNLTVRESDPTVPQETLLFARQLDAQDQAIYWKMIALDALTEINLDYSRFNFFRDFTSNDLLSQRLQTNINLLLPLLGTRGVSFSESIDNVSGSPAAEIAYVSSASSVSTLIPGRYGGWLGSTFETFRDTSGNLFDRDTQTFSFRPSRHDRQQSYAASLELKNSDLEGIPQSDRRSRLAINYARDITASTSFHADFSSRSRSRAIAENGYTKRADAAEVSLLYLSDWGRVSGGYRRTEMDRRNRSQTVTEPVSFDRWWVRAAARPNSWLKLRASYDQRNLDEAPTALNSGLSPIPNLVRDEVKRVSLRAEANLGSRGNAWAERVSRRQELESRNTAFRETADRIGVSGGLSSGLGFSGSLAKVDYSSTSAALSSPFSDYNYLIFSLWYPLRSRGSLTGNYSIWDADGGNEAKERAFSVGYQIPVWRGGSASAEYQFVKDTEAGPLDFSARLLTLAVGLAF